VHIWRKKSQRREIKGKEKEIKGKGRKGRKNER
jgi:hypothetical protein